MQSGNVKIAGQDMPIYYGMFARQQYLDELGINIADMADEEKTEQILNRANTLEGSIRLAYICIKDGHRKAKKEFSLTYEDFCDLLDDEPDYLSVLNTISEYVTGNSPAVETPTAKNGKAPKQAKS